MNQYRAKPADLVTTSKTSRPSANFVSVLHVRTITMTGRHPAVTMLSVVKKQEAVGDLQKPFAAEELMAAIKKPSVLGTSSAQ